MARALATNGAKRVYLLGRRLEVLQEAAKLDSAIFTPIQCNITSHASLQSAVDRIASETGYINLLIANGGIPGPPTRFNPNLPLSQVRANMFTELAMEATTATFAVNTTGAFFTIVAFLELLDAGNQHAVQHGGFGAPLREGSDVPSIQSQVIVVGSIAAYSRMDMSSPAYAGSKAAVVHLTKHSSSNLARYGIRANALAPGCKLLPT
jgi:NAD(P)-dependent dehydrogenase (short-subunit alcohol dehydrogenase family)